jgi:hypothetical protein
MQQMCNHMHGHAQQGEKGLALSRPRKGTTSRGSRFAQRARAPAGEGLVLSLFQLHLAMCLSNLFELSIMITTLILLDQLYQLTSYRRKP